MKKLIFPILLVGIFGFIGIAKADIIYERTPSEYLVESPITFEVSGNTGFQSWKFVISPYPSGEQILGTECFTEGLGVSVIAFEGGFKALLVVARNYTNELDCTGAFEEIALESDEGNAIFEIMGEEPEPTAIITGMGGVVSGGMGLVGEIFADILPFLALIIGLPLGFWVIRRVIGLVKAR